EEYSFLCNRIFEIFREAKKQELIKRKSYTKDYLNFSKKLYYKKLLLWDDILKLLSQETEIDNLLAKFPSGQSDSTDAYLIDYLPLLAIDGEKLIYTFNKVRNEDTLQKLHEEYMRYKYKAVRD